MVLKLFHNFSIRKQKLNVYEYNILDDEKSFYTPIIECIMTTVIYLFYFLIY